VKIRLASRDDLPALERLVGWAAKELAADFDTPQHPDHLKLIEWGIDAGEAVVVAEQEGDVIG
jgi:hypothetical protein